MKIAITSNGAFIDQRDGSLVEGRLSVYLRDSDDLATTYTLEGNDFVQAENPVLLHSGLPDDTLFADAGIYRLKVEKYTGPEGQMSVDADPAYFEQVDIYEVGFDWDSAVSNAQNVDSIDDLRSVDPSVGSVTVLSYYSIGDCCPRTYVWDSASVDAVDGGYVVGSDVSDTGRWILLWADEILPCSVYGVSAGHEANLNSLFQYPRLVGSFSFVTAPCIRFTRGEYTTAVNLTTDKELVFDGDARFTAATIQCPKVRVLGSRSSYVGDFTLMAKDAEAHSSWFRTVNSFWRTPAPFLYIDATNYFEDFRLTANADLGGKTIVGSTRIATVYAAKKYIYVGSNTSITGRIFNANDYVKLGNGCGDGMFSTVGTWDPGLISAGHHVEYEYTPDLDLFENADRWISTMVERRSRISDMGDTLDFQNRKVGNVNAGLFTTIKNLYTDRLTVNNPTATIVLEKVQTPEVVATCSTLYMDGSDILFKAEPSVSYLTGRDSYISVSGAAWRSMSMYVALTDCQIEGMDFRKDADNEDYGGGISLTDCIVHNCKLYAKAMHLFGCNVSQSEIRFLPYFNDSEYHIDPKLVGNRFNGPSPVLFTKAVESEDCYDCVLTAEITGNTFNGNADGIECRYWSDRTGINYTRTFVDTASSSVVYSGNSGNCPKESGKGILISDNTDYSVQTVGGVDVYKYNGTSFRGFPKFKGTRQFWYYADISGEYDTLAKWKLSDTAMYIHGSWGYYFRGHDSVTGNGDYFALGISTIGDFIKIDSTASGIAAKVI